MPFFSVVDGVVVPLSHITQVQEGPVCMQNDYFHQCKVIERKKSCMTEAKRLVFCSPASYTQTCIQITVGFLDASGHSDYPSWTLRSLLVLLQHTCCATTVDSLSFFFPVI
jgi:hypothetical protein